MLSAGIRVCVSSSGRASASIPCATRSEAGDVEGDRRLPADCERSKRPPVPGARVESTTRHGVRRVPRRQLENWRFWRIEQAHWRNEVAYGTSAGAESSPEISLVKRFVDLGFL